MRRLILSLAAATLLATSALAQDWAAKGTAAISSGDNVRAAIFLEKAVAQNPTNLDNLYALTHSYGALYIYDKEVDCATRLLDAARSQKDKEMEKRALQHLAYAYCYTDRFAEADDCIARARKIDPDQDFIDYVEIKVAQRRGQTDVALDKAQKAIDKYAPDASSYFSILEIATDLQIQNGEADKAIDFLRKAFSSCQSYGEANSYRNVLVSALMKSGKFSQAIIETTQMRQNNSVQTLCDSASNSFILHLRAMERNSEASSFPWWASNTYGIVLSNLARLPQAAEKFHSARQIGSLYWTPFASISQEADCYNRMHNPARAAVLADMALACDSDVFSAEEIKMRAAIEMGDRQTALDLLSKWNNRFGQTSPLSECLLQMGDVQLAKQWLPTIEERIAYEQATVRPMAAYAVLLQMLGQHDKAVATAQKVIDLIKKYDYDKDGVSVNYIDCCALAAPSDPVANKAADALVKSPTAAPGHLRAVACLRASQGRADEALQILTSALHCGTPVCLAKSHPLLSSVRSLLGFADALRPFEDMIAKSKAPEWTTTSTIAYKGSESNMTIKAEVDGVPMDVNVNYNGQDADAPSIGYTDYEFLVKNDHATRANGSNGTIKGLKIGDTLIGDIWVNIVPVSQSLTLTRSTLVRLGRMQIDKAAKTLKFDNTL